MTDFVRDVYAASHAEAVTTSDTVNLAYNSRALYVGTTGNVVVEMVGGEVVTFTGVPAGTILPIQVARVNATSTTAATIVSLR